MSDEERTPERIATELRDAVDEVNRLLREAAEQGCKVEVEVARMPLMDRLSQDATHVRLAGVYRRIEPEPKPVEVPPARPKRPVKGS